jgi:hypothetical protein
MSPQLPGWLVRGWGLDPMRRTGDWQSAVRVGDSLPGFTAAAVETGHTLALRGRHRFSKYELHFELEPVPGGLTRLRALTWAAFPGLSGHLYRAAVIGSGGHRVAVRRILGKVAYRAEGAHSGRSAD